MEAFIPLHPIAEQILSVSYTHLRRNIRITEHGDLNEIYRRTYNDTTLYKPVKEGWYIELDLSIIHI